MRVIIEKKVHFVIEDFYRHSLMNHITLTESSVRRKKKRLYEALASLGDYAFLYPKSRYKQDWITNNYRDFICEDFHFAYTIEVLYSGEEVVAIHDACHSFLFYNPEDKE